MTGATSECNRSADAQTFRCGSAKTPTARTLADARSMNTEIPGSWRGSDTDAGRAPHCADAVELGLLAHIVGCALAHLVALVEQLDLLELFECLGERHARVLELNFQLVGRTFEIVAPSHRGLGVGRIGEVHWIVNSGAVLLGADFPLQIGGHAVEVRHHALDLRYPAPLLVDLKLPQANERVTRLHRLVLPRSPMIRRGQYNGPIRFPTGVECGTTTLVLCCRTTDDLFKARITFSNTC